MPTKMPPSKVLSREKTPWTDPVSMIYHSNQWDTPKQSTKAFSDFVSEYLKKSKKVVDLGCGAGAPTAYLAQKYLDVVFTGLDYSSELISFANKMALNKQISNLTFEQGDWSNLTQRNDVDGVVSLQTLSWIPEYETPLLQIFRKIRPQWIAVTGLFYEGDITCIIEVTEHKKSNRKVYYNVYSIPAVKRLCEKQGYFVSKVSRFEIDIDIDEPNDIDIMGTYTKRAISSNANGFERLQISGPLLLNWYSLLIEKAV